MAGRLRDRQLTVQLTQAELDVFETARRALHSRGAVRQLPSQADTVSILAAALCYRAGHGGHVGCAPQCRTALAAWEREKGAYRLQRVLGGWLAPPDG